jgi:CDP-2,3-bis-(O-geranylgeranyl)-sn-glycerol synthase
VNEILFALWFFAPAGIANGAPVFANKISLLDKFGKPIDHGKSWRGKRIFGDHKTYRGFLVGVIVAVFIAAIQMILYTNFDFFSVEITNNIDYSDPKVLVLGAFLGFGALAGDAVKSFFKRQLSVPSGKSWFPFDQIDYILGGLIMSVPIVALSPVDYLAVFIVWAFLHPIATFIAWILKLKDSPI